MKNLRATVRGTLRAASLVAVCLASSLALSLAAASAAQASQHDSAESEQAAKKPAPPNLQQRKEIFVGLMRAEARANREAEAAAKAKGKPEAMAQDAMAEKLTAKYRAAVLKKYGVTQKMAVAIVAEGYQHHWATGQAKPGPAQTELP